MIKSMTAFSRVTLPSGGKNWIIEIKSLNQRYFELALRLPPSLFSMENQVRQLIQSSMGRGKVSLSISEEGNGEQVRTYAIDRGQVQAYLASSKKLARQFKLDGALSVGDIFKLPGVVREKNDPAGKAISWVALSSILKKGIDRAIKHKYAEGQKLEKDLRLRLDKIAKTADAIEAFVAGGKTKTYEKLRSRIQELLGDGKIDEDRMAREVAFLTDRSDITEELVRMRSHLDLFRKWLDKDGEVGREMDFLCQEMMREANTMASKAQFFEVSKDAISIKSEVEKIREQVQNVE
jgi:uncharacterized protein (TIGR00255 family)